MFCSTDLCRVMLEADMLCVHNIQQNLEGDDQIGIDDGARLMPFIVRETTRVNDAHLLDDCGLSRFSRT